MLVGQDEAARIGQPLDTQHRRHAAEGGQDHREPEWQVVRGLDRAVLGLRGTDHDWPGIFAEPVERLGGGGGGMVGSADRLGKAIGAKASDFVESQIGSGGEDEVIISD